jgi:hypothetical protein
MRIILKSLDGLKILLNSIQTENRTSLNDWFLNASDEDLSQAILLLNSKESLELYPRHHLKEYIKFAKSLLLGALPHPPSDLDLSETIEINYFNFAKGSFKLLFILSSVIQSKLKTIFKKISILGLTQTQVIKTTSLLKITRPIASFCRVLASRVFVTFKISFNRLLKFKSPCLRHKVFVTHLQKKKLILRSIREMIKKGKVNLEQRAFWTWLVIFEESKYGKISSLKEDFHLLRQIFHTSNLRHFQTTKHSFDHWKSQIPIKIHSLLSISPDTMHRPSSKSYLKHHFRRKLKTKLMPILSLVYRPIAHCFNKISKFALKQQEEYDCALRLASMMPHFRNLIHVQSRVLIKSLKKWKAEIFEYEYLETTLLQEKKNFGVAFKPLILLEYHEGSRGNKILIRNLTHILIRKFRNFWNVWKRTKKIDLNFSAEVTLDLSLFKLPNGKLEKLNLVFYELKEIFEVKKNLPKVYLSKWIQAATKRLVTVSRVQYIMNRLLRDKESKKHAFSAFKLNLKNQTEFTDVF